jgi:hypothetical protein
MRRLDPPDLLRIWESGVALHPIDRALAILGDAQAARLPLGARDARLLELRAASLGDRLAATEACPACGERVDLELSCRALIGAAAPAPAAWTVEHDELRIGVRPLDSLDAAQAASAGDIETAAATLLERAVTTVEPPGSPLSDAAAAAVTASLAEHDPGAELLIELACPACGAAWQRVLDVAGFVWTELAARAERLIDDVHRLARAYGWSEAEILALGEPRRAAYLAMVEG